MKNNINNLISEELKKVTLLFKYDTQKTLSENIVEQQVGDKNTQATVASTTPSTEPTSVLITKNDNAYEYKMENGKYYFKGKPGTKFATTYPDWKEAKAQKGITAIKALFDKTPKGDTPVEVKNQTPTDNSEKYKEFFAQKQKDAQNLPKTLPVVQGVETSKQQNDGIKDSNVTTNNTQVQGKIQTNVSNDEEF